MNESELIMDKQQLIEAITKKRHVNVAVVGMAYDEIFAAIIEAVAAGVTVEVPGFGKFYRAKRHLGRTRMLSSKLEPGFSPDLNFRDAVRGTTGEV